MLVKAVASALLLTGLGLSAAAIDDAGSTLSTPQVVVVGDHSLDCFVTNVSDASHVVSIHIVAADSHDVIEPSVLTLQPGQEGAARAHAALAPRSCRFVLDGESKDFLGTAVVREPDGQGMTAIEAL
jgi:hypothetical protein